MQILIAVHHFPPRYTGGAEWRAYRTARALLERGHAARVVCVEHVDRPAPGGLGWVDEVYEGVPVRRLSFDLSAAPDPFVWSYDNPLIGAHIEQMLGETHPDIFHLISGYLMSASVLRAARSCGVPSVVSLTDYWFLCPRFSLLRSDGTLSTLPIEPARCARCLAEERRRWRLPGQLAPALMDGFWRRQKPAVQRVERRLHHLMAALNQADAIISPSQFLRSVYIQAGADPARVRYARQGHDFPALTPDMLQKTAADRLRVGYIGQIAPHKGVHLLVEAVRSLPDAPLALEVYGDMQAQPRYTRALLAAAAGDARIRFHGVFPRGEISRVMQGLDVVAAPSTWYENSPNAILEAFAHRTPVIASRLGGMAELVQQDAGGWLFETGEAADLAALLDRLARNPALVEAARAGIPPNKSIAAEMDELLAVYQALAEPKEQD